LIFILFELDYKYLYSKAINIDKCLGTAMMNS
jgi:hypothetical protein